jgi:thiamine-phosphate pyrophosphorylase
LLLCYITDRTQFPGTEAQRRKRLLAKITEAALCGVDYIQLREKDLPARDLEALARDAARATRNLKGEARLLINSRTDIALATGAGGVHLRSDDIPASDARVIASVVLSRNAKRETRDWLIGVSCHTLAEVQLAESHGADFAVFGPVFGKTAGDPATGLQTLRQICARGVPADRKTEAVTFGRMPVLALGGVNLENATACIAAGAAGIAGIRLFQENNIAKVVESLRGKISTQV